MKFINLRLNKVKILFVKKNLEITLETNATNDSVILEDKISEIKIYDNYDKLIFSSYVPSNVDDVIKLNENNLIIDDVITLEYEDNKIMLLINLLTFLLFILTGVFIYYSIF